MPRGRGDLIMADASPKTKISLPASHPLKLKEAQLLEKQKALNGMDGHGLSASGHNLREAKERLEMQLAEIQAAIDKEEK